MIRTIEGTYFQSWEYFNITLSPGVNVIKGDTHSGKSGMVRLIKWATLNDPNRGDYFTSWFAPEKAVTSVGIEYDDDSYIIRKKGKGVNGYDLSTGDLPTIGTDLPDEVKAITRMGPINIQEQDEQYYMLKETPGTVAKELSSIVGLDIIEETLSKLNSLENTNNAKLKILEKDADDIKTGLAELDFVDTLEAKIEEVEALWEEYQEALNRKQNIVRLAEEIEEEDEFVKEISEWLTIKEPVERLRGLIAEYAEIQRSLEILKSAYDDICHTEIVKHHANAKAEELGSKRDSIIKSKAYKEQFCQTCGAFIDYWRKK